MKQNRLVYLVVVLFAIILAMTAACQTKDEATPDSSAVTEPAPAPVTETAAEEPETAVEEPETAATEPPAPTPTDTPQPAPTEPAIIETLTADIGAEGGALTSSDGAMELYFPPDALTEATQVTIVLRPAAATDTTLLSPLFEISLAPPLAEPLTNPAIMTYKETVEEGARFGRLMTLVGEIEAMEGDAPDAITYWQPLEYTQLNEEGQLQLWLPDFSTYAVLGEQGGDCAEIDLSPPPPPPDGYAYVGRHVTFNRTITATRPIKLPLLRPSATGSITDTLSTAPLGRPNLPDDRLVYQTQDVPGCGPVTAVDFYTPITPVTVPSSPEICQPTDQILRAPDAPPGHQHYSTEVTIFGMPTETSNFISEGVSPPPAGGASTIIFTKSAGSEDNPTCSTEVRHIYTPLPQGQSDTIVQDCIPGEEVMTPPSPPSGYVYVGSDVIINATWVTDLSTVPPDRLPSPQDIVMPSSSTTTRNGTLICESTIAHVFEPDETTQSCAPPAWVAFSAPPPPAGFTYMGYEVAVNGSEMSALPPILPGPQDFHVTDSYNATLASGDASCAYDVDYVYKPESQGACVVPEALSQAPPIPACFRDIGDQVAINHDLTQFTMPLDRQAQATDLIHVNSGTTMVNGADACQINVAHFFEQIECAPPEFTITAGAPPFSNENERFTNLFFPPEANLSPADREYLMSISIRPPFDREDGSLSIALPPGTEVTSEGDQVTIQIPQTD